MLRSAYEAITNSRFGVFPAQAGNLNTQYLGFRRVISLRPYRTARALYPKSPLDLLPEKLRPAKDIKKLSPADRVFGWVNQDASTNDPHPAYRGHVRVGPVICHTENAIERFRTPVVLAILGQPKPQQGRFYLGKMVIAG